MINNVTSRYRSGSDPSAGRHNVAMRFRAVVQLNGKTATGIPVPIDVVEGLGAGKRPKVRVTIGDYVFRTSVAGWGDGYMLSLSAEHRAGAGVAAGDTVDVDLELDTQPRVAEVPADFAAAIDADAAARAFFDGLSYSQKRWFTLSIDGAKTAETRQRRIDKYVVMLREGRAR